MIAEDSVLLREGLIRLLQAFEVEVVAAVGDAVALITAVEHEIPDLVIMDVRMPPTFSDEGMRAAAQLRRSHPQIAMLLLSQYVEERYAIDLLSSRAGGIGYLLKDRIADVGEFISSLRQVADGGTVLDAEVVAQLLVRKNDDPLTGLTPREKQVLGLMAEGRSNSGIAAALVISESAVAKHTSSIFSRLSLPVLENDHRRVLAVLRYLNS